MARDWTPAQGDAIEARGGALLVSAAAGSGKTAVLVERVIRRITDPQNPVDADRLLVVTFTKAAAAEMRGRISEKLGALLEEAPDSLFLQRQQILLSRAHISTIHSFCQELLREYFHQLGVPPDFRIADENELSVLRENALQSVLEACFAADDPAFFALLDAFSAGHDDAKLVATVYQLYDFVRSHPFPKRWLREKARLYDAGSAEASPWGRVVLAHARRALCYCRSVTDHSLRLLEGAEEKLLAAYLPAFTDDRRMLGELEGPLQNGAWDKAVNAVQGAAFQALGKAQGFAEDPVKLAVCANREEVKDTVKSLKKLLVFTGEDCERDFSTLKPLVETLFALLLRFSDALDEQKAERRLADFGDLEHWTLRLLVKETPEGFERTAAAAEISRRFDEIMVDEYQDTNEAQDLLFRALSRGEENLFMVGDVKQSIYSFRQAMPELFLTRRKNSGEFDRACPRFPAYINLDRNFRSRRGVTEGVNFVFRQLMSEEAGQLDYTEGEALVCGAVYPETEDASVELDLLERLPEDGGDLLEAECRRIAELVADWTARPCVAENGTLRPAEYRDVCILLRSANKYAPLYARALARLGVPAWADAGKGFFSAPEVGVALSLLRAVDNPLQDVPMLALLMSPICGFTPDDLAPIRARVRKGSLYTALRQAADEGDGRAASFLEQLSAWRALSAALPADRLIGALYSQTGYPDLVLAMENGGQRLANLRLLQERARAYAQSGRGSLSGFLRFVERLRAQGNDFAMAGTLSETANVVRIMSIHRSKGLEFPLVILAGCSRRFNLERGDVLLHPQLGLGIKLRERGTDCRYTTLPREADALKLREGEMSEELRVLYVALTRAKEKLVLLCTVKDAQKTLSSLSSRLTEDPVIPPYAVQGAASLSDWLLLCALRHPDGGRLRELAGASLPVLPCGEPWDIRVLHDRMPEEDGEQAAEITPLPPEDPALTETLGRYLSFQYPYAALGAVRAKTAASELAGKSFERQYAAMSRPAFLGKKGLTPAERGTALHAFLQFSDWQVLSRDMKGELDRLVTAGFLTAEQGAAVDLRAVAAFCAAPVFVRMLRSPEVLREYRFSVEIEAARLDPALSPEMAAEPVVLQGAVDCTFREGDHYVLVDFKTDRVKDQGELWARYEGQLALYREALEACLGLPVSEGLLYSFSLGREVRAPGSV